MSNAIRSRTLERLERLLDTIPLHLNQPRANHKPRPIKPVMTMHTNLRLVVSGLTGRLQTTLDERDEPRDILFRWRDFRRRGEFMVCDGCVEEGCRIVRCVHAVRNINDVSHIRILSNQMVRRMRPIRLAKCLP
jgi:hypothetical protein